MISFSCDVCHGPIKRNDGLMVYAEDRHWIVCDSGGRLAVDPFEFKAEKIGHGHLACSLKCMTVAVNKWLEDKQMWLQKSRAEYERFKEKGFISTLRRASDTPVELTETAVKITP